MKREDIRRIFPEATDEQIDSVLNQIGTELNPLKNQLDEAQRAVTDANTQHSAALTAQRSEYEQQIAALNEQLKAGMSEEDKLKAAMEEAERRTAEYTLKSNTLDARSIFIDAGLNEEAYTPLLSQVVSTDVDETKARANAIVALLQSQRNAVEQATKDQLLKSNPGLQGAGGATSVSKDAFDKMDYMQKLELMQENPDFLHSIEKKPY